MDGQGTYTYPNGDKYVGEFSKGKKDGSGKLYFEDGTIYYGNFKNNLIFGRGTFKTSEDIKFSGIWTGKITGWGKKITKDDITYGEFKNGFQENLGQPLEKDSYPIKKFVDIGLLTN